jgi:hypothetical protein
VTPVIILCATPLSHYKGVTSNVRSVSQSGTAWLAHRSYSVDRVGGRADASFTAGHGGKLTCYSEESYQ